MVPADWEDARVSPGLCQHGRAVVHTGDGELEPQGGVEETCEPTAPPAYIQYLPAIHTTHGAVQCAVCYPVVLG